MRCKVSDEALIVEFKQAKGVFLFRAGKEDVARMVSKASQMDAVFLAGYRFGSSAFLDIINMHGFVV